MIWTIICFIFSVYMTILAVSKKNAGWLLFYLFVDIAIAACVVTWPTFFSGGVDANLFYCGVLGFINMVGLVIVLMLT